MAASPARPAGSRGGSRSWALIRSSGEPSGRAGTLPGGGTRANLAPRLSRDLSGRSSLSFPQTRPWTQPPAAWTACRLRPLLRVGDGHRELDCWPTPPPPSQQFGVHWKTLLPTRGKARRKRDPAGCSPLAPFYLKPGPEVTWASSVLLGPKEPFLHSAEHRKEGKAGLGMWAAAWDVGCSRARSPAVPSVE